jgi:hypothetical protein
MSKKPQHRDDRASASPDEGKNGSHSEESPTSTGVDMTDGKHQRKHMHLPHEADQTPDNQSIQPKPVIKQAYQDLKRGLVDTDMRGMRGVEKVVADKDQQSGQSGKNLPKEDDSD